MLVFACHTMILSWTTTTPDFFFATLVTIRKNYWWFIDYICNIFLILWKWKHCDVADWKYFASHHTSWNISSAILKILLFFKAWLQGLNYHFALGMHFTNCEVNSYYCNRNVSHSMKNVKQFFRFKINLIKRYEEWMVFLL